MELFVVDFTYDDFNSLAGDIRNKTDALLPNGVQYLSSNIANVNTVLGTNPVQLAQDLLAVIGPGSLPAQSPHGSILSQLNDPTTPGILVSYKY